MAVKKKTASKKAASKVKPKPLPPKPKRKASPAPKRAQPKAKTPAVAKKAKAQAVAAAPKPSAPARSTLHVAVVPPQSQSAVARPGLQKRPDATPIGVVHVTDGDRVIEQSTFYSAEGRDEYVERWEARGYTCRFTSWNGLS